jgi:hypothetical protein
MITYTDEIEEIGELLDECRDDPDLFNERFLDGRGYWSRQQEIAESVVKYRVTVAYSGNMVGKDFLFARLMLWWLYTRPDSLVIVRGPTQRQLGAIVWKEVSRAIKAAPLPFMARVTAAIQASPQVIDLGGGHQALGFSTKSVESASGLHAGELLVLVIEGSGVEQEVWDSIDSLGYERLAVNGNPLRADGEFVRLIQQAAKDKADGVPPELAVNAIQISSFESPHAQLDHSPWGLADKTWLATSERKYGKDSLWYRSHVLAIVPSINVDILIPEEWINYAYNQVRQAVDGNHPIHLTRRLACDLGEGVGRDSTCVIVRDDWGVLACVHGSALGLPEAAAQMAKLGQQFSIPAERMSYDKLGIGRHFPNHLAKYGLQYARPYAGSAPALSRDFVNLRTEAAWNLRNRLDPQHIPDIRLPHARQVPFSFRSGPYLERLREELGHLTYSLVSNQTKLLDKEDWTDILGHSPDIADTLIQSFAYAD